MLELARDDPRHARGGAQVIGARAPGTTTVRARVAAFEAELVVTVNP